MFKMDPSSVALFTSHWETYQKVVEWNYMHHRECMTLLTEKVKDEPPLQILDLGCGDAGTLAAALSHTAIERYHGYDLSPVALDLCKKNIERLAKEVQLKEGRMEALLEQEAYLFNVVHAGYAIHHLHDSEKQKLIAAIYKRTEAGGIFILIDIYRSVNMERDAYITAYIDKIRTRWSGLEEVEIRRIEEHIRNYDFPSTKEQLIAWCTGTGFSLENEVVLDAHHVLLVLRK